eukprot:2948476-Pyramimonas_sp.AAC.1
MSAHLSPASTSANEGSSAGNPPGLGSRSVRIPNGNATFGCALPALPPPSAPPATPARATLRLEGGQSRSPVRKLVKFLLEWNRHE